MSLLLAGGATGAGTPPDTPPTPTFAIPGTNNPTSAALQPTWHQILRVGPTRSHTAIESAIIAARAAYAHPAHHRILIAVDPGTYTPSTLLAVGDGIDIAGMGASRDDVTIKTTTINYSLLAWSTVYVANLTLWKDPGSLGNTYPLHGSVTRGTGHTDTYDNVRFYDNHPDAFGAAGWDMTNGTRAWLHRCSFESAYGHGIVFHDISGSDVETVYLLCTSDLTPPNPFPNPLTQPTKIGQTWIVGCTKLDGTPYPDTYELNKDGQTPFTGTIPLPAHPGMAEPEYSRYWPTTIGTPVQHTPTGTLGDVTLTAGRMYYVPLPPMTATGWVDRVTLPVTSAPGQVAFTLYRGTPNQPDWTYLWYPGWTTASDGNVTQTPPAGKFLLERGESYWVGVRATNAITARGATRAGCFYRDDAPADEATPPFHGTPLALSGPAPIPTVHTL